MSLRAGDTIEHFVIVSPLGEGGMGQVYVARDTRLQRSIALKIMTPEPTGDGSGKGTSNGAARLLREAQSAAGLEHPNVVTIYEVGEIKGEGEEAGRPFIAMELVKGKPLRAFVGDERVPMKERVRWLVDIARALAAAHLAGLVHRDIKPENVMVRDDGVIKVLDFGLAKRAASTSNSVSSSTEAQVLPSLTGKGIAIGTPYYMAPEQMRNEVLDGRADQFSWGVVAYELLSGSPAWGRDIGALELVSKLLSEDPMPLMELRPDVPAHVATAVTRAMAKRRASRFGTMEEVISALEDPSGVFAPTMPRISLSSPELPGAPSPQPVEPRGTTTVSLRPQRRRRALLVLAAAGVATLSALAFVAASRQGAHPPVAAIPDSATTAASAPADAGFPDFGSPMSKNPEAAAAYRKGMSSQRDADEAAGTRALEHAVALDPEFAAAHLRLGLERLSLDLPGREHLRDAVRLRTGLGPHDRILLDAVAPLLEVPQNLVESGKRLAAAFERAPSDPDLALALCRARQATGDFRAAREVCARAKELDPEAAAPILEAALVAERLEDMPDAVALLDTCLRMSPLATSCLDPLVQLQTYGGRCTEALTTARRIVLIHPESPEAYDRLAIALAGAGEPIESVRSALEQKLKYTSPEDVPVMKLHDAVLVDLFTGDFVDANARLRSWSAIEASSPFEGDHFLVTVTRIVLAEEEGKNAEAASLIKAYLKKRPGWKLATESDYSFYFIGQLHALGALPQSDYVAQRARWLTGEKARSAGGRFLWVDAYAIPAVSEADAREALEALPDLSPLPDPMNWTPEWEGPIGETYRLAGRGTEALPFLSRAAESCAVLESPLEETWATFNLGRALEEDAQTTAACDAYATVVRRWPKTPSSVTAAKARERMSALGCPK